MGLAIDYALFVVSRFREELARRPARRPGRGRLRPDHDDAHRRPHRPVLRPHRRRRDVARCWCSRSPSCARWGTAGSRPCWSRCWPRSRCCPRRCGCSAVGSTHGRRRAAPPPGRPTADARRLGPDRPRRDAPPGRVLVGVTAGLLVLASPFLGVEVGLGRPPVLPADAPSYVAHGEARDRVRLRERRAPTCCSRAPTPADVAAYVGAVEARRRRDVGAAGRRGRRRDAAAGRRGRATRQTERVAGAGHASCATSSPRAARPWSAA